MAKTYNSSSIGSLCTTISELKLIWFSQRGDRDAFSCLYDTYLDRIHRYIYFRVDDPELAEDITSLVFLKAWENLDTFQAERSPFAAWLYRIAHNAVIDHFRTRKIIVPLEEVQPVQLSQSYEVDEKLDLKILSQELLEALKELTETQREVLILRFICGYTTLEIARSLNKHEGAVRALQMRGLKKLAQFPAIQRERVFE